MKNNYLRPIGALLVAAAIALQLYTNSRDAGAARRHGATVGNVLAVELRQYLRQSTDSLRSQFEQKLHSQAGELEFFDYLKGMKDRGEIFAAFIETKPQGLMENGGELDSLSAALFGLMTLTTTPAPPLPSTDDLDQFSEVVKERLERTGKIEGSRYLYSEDQSDLIWYVVPFVIGVSDKIQMGGISFKPRRDLSPAARAVIEKQFLTEPVWQWAVTPGDEAYALDLVNPDGASVHSVGDTAGKTPAASMQLDKSDLNYSGWRLRAWVRDYPSGGAFWVTAALAALGIVLLLV